MTLAIENEVPTIISNLNAQLTEWLEAGKLQRVALVIMSKDAGEVSERWKLVPKLIARLRYDEDKRRETEQFWLILEVTLYARVNERSLRYLGEFLEGLSTNVPAPGRGSMTGKPGCGISNLHVMPASWAQHK
ncbi:mitotic spindle checkpoint protein MAD2-like isoform X2 [Lycium barbarum]|uniref:mitotic spindle checkpoint protein MAD2-like isoform X2 n=1 Tax=Lycium barbarum TaxID=112863 RepID=UPI00293EBF6A|nr:mitotic spindle checkpoint protein MAD2-like isoform X2 [Lycium barbarum]